MMANQAENNERLERFGAKIPLYQMVAEKQRQNFHKKYGVLDMEDQSQGY